MAGLPALSDILEEYQLVDAEDRYRLLIDLGRQLEPMPNALKTDATKVRGCSASVWVYPTANGGRLHFLADSNAAITKGIVALILIGGPGQACRRGCRVGFHPSTRTLRAFETFEREPHPGRSQHDRTHEANGGTFCGGRLEFLTRRRSNPLSQ